MDNAEYAEIIRSGRNIHIAGRICQESYTEFLKYLENKLKTLGTDTLTVTLSTGGGEVDYGWCFYNLLSSLRREIDLRIVINGFIRSVGVVIMLAADKQNRFALPHSHIYCHRIKLELTDTPSVTTDELTYTAEEHAMWIANAKYIERVISGIISQETNLSIVDARKLIRNPRLIRADEAVKLGFISDILI